MPADGPGPFTGMRRDEAVRVVRTALAASGIAEAHAEARALVLRALALPSEALVLAPEALLAAEEAAILGAWCARRCAHEPIGRIAGAREFYGRPFRLSPATLEPRPDTETVIDATLEIVDRKGLRDTALRIVDIGTGSGCLLLTLLAELPRATGLGTDISEEALATAAGNANSLGLDSRASWQCTPGLARIGQTFDILVSNPPYIPAADIQGLDPEVRCFDPRAARDGGADGLDVYRDIAEGLARIIPGGVAVLEFGARQASDVIAVFMRSAPQFEVLGVWRDLGGHERCVALGILCKR